MDTEMSVTTSSEPTLNVYCYSDVNFVSLQDVACGKLSGSVRSFTSIPRLLFCVGQDRSIYAVPCNSREANEILRVYLESELRKRISPELCPWGGEPITYKQISSRYSGRVINFDNVRNMVEPIILQGVAEYYGLQIGLPVLVDDGDFNGECVILKLNTGEQYRAMIYPYITFCGAKRGRTLTFPRETLAGSDFISVAQGREDISVRLPDYDTFKNVKYAAGVWELPSRYNYVSSGHIKQYVTCEKSKKSSEPWRERSVVGYFCSYLREKRPNLFDSTGRDFETEISQEQHRLVQVAVVQREKDQIIENLQNRLHRTESDLHRAKEHIDKLFDIIRNMSNSYYDLLPRLFVKEDERGPSSV